MVIVDLGATASVQQKSFAAHSRDERLRKKKSLR
jgi:hypothetical protein